MPKSLIAFLQLAFGILTILLFYFVGIALIECFIRYALFNDWTSVSILMSSGVTASLITVHQTYEAFKISKAKMDEKQLAAIDKEGEQK